MSLRYKLEVLLFLFSIFLLYKDHHIAWSVVPRLWSETGAMTNGKLLCLLPGDTASWKSWPCLQQCNELNITGLQKNIVAVQVEQQKFEVEANTENVVKYKCI